MLVLQKCRVLCTPKTGSTWLANTLSRVCLVQEEYSGPGNMGHHVCLLESPRQELPAIACVRHPLSWYQSYWALRVCDGWKEDHEIDECRSDDFTTFMSNAVRLFPGWMSGYLQKWIGTPADGVHVVRFEALIPDLLRVLAVLGETVKAHELFLSPPENVSAVKRSRAMWTDELIDAVLVSEREIISRYYS